MSPDGKLIITTDWNNQINVLNAKSLKIIDSLDGHKSQAAKIAMPKDQTTVISAGETRLLKIWRGQ